MQRIASIAIALAALSCAEDPALAADFTGKTITVSVGFPPGGGYDTYTRVFARHFGKHVPGKPGLVVQNQPGAGSLVAANTLYNIAPKDGTQLAMFAASVALEPLLGNPQAKFDAAKFTWLGNINKDVASCGVWTKSGVKSFNDAMTREVKIGGSGPGAITVQHALFLKNMLGAKIKVIAGYGGTNDINLAMQRGEVDATCGMFLSSVLGPYAKDVKDGNLKIVIQFGRQDVPEFGDAVNVYKLLKSDEDRQIADFVFLQSEIARPIAAPPGLTKDVADTLKKAFDDTMRDPEFIADATKANIQVGPMSSAELSKAFADFAAMPPAVLEKAKDAITKP